jgi:hypothetical protein
MADGKWKMEDAERERSDCERLLERRETHGIIGTFPL